MVCRTVVDVGDFGYLKLNANFYSELLDLMNAMLAACYSTTYTDSILQIVQYFYEKRVLVNVGDRLGVTPLMYASINGHLELVKFLVQYSSLDAKDNQQYTVILLLLFYQK